MLFAALVHLRGLQHWTLAVERSAFSGCSVCYCGVSKVIALSSFEHGSEIALPPLVRFVKVAHFHFVRAWVLCKPVAKSKVAVETHKFSEINVGHTRVATNYQHVLIVVRGGGIAKVGRAGHDERVGSQRIDQHIFGM